MNSVLKGLRKNCPEAYEYLKNLTAKQKEKLLYDSNGKKLGELFSWYNSKQGNSYWKDIADEFKRESWIKGEQ